MISTKWQLTYFSYRITKPPGGDASDIFGASSPTTTPPTTPRKVKNYLASNIFSAEKDTQPKARARPDDDSFKRLFGAGGNNAPDGGSPVRVKNYQKSSIINAEAPATNGSATNGTNGATPNGKGHTNGHASPNGHGSDSGMGSGSVTPNGSNGSTNGDAEPKTSKSLESFLRFK